MEQFNFRNEHTVQTTYYYTRAASRERFFTNAVTENVGPTLYDSVNIGSKPRNRSELVVRVTKT